MTKQIKRVIIGLNIVIVLLLCITVYLGVRLSTTKSKNVLTIDGQNVQLESYINNYDTVKTIISTELNNDIDKLLKEVPTEYQLIIDGYHEIAVTGSGEYEILKISNDGSKEYYKILIKSNHASTINYSSMKNPNGEIDYFAQSYNVDTYEVT